MFPINLQRNIDQLGKQISLLENECKNLEMEKKRRSLKSQPTSGNKPSDIRMKPAVKAPVQKNNICRKSRKSTPPATDRLHSTTSHLSHCSKPWSENGGTVVKRKALNIPVGSSQPLDSPHTVLRKDNGCAKCVCYNQGVMSEFDRGDCSDFSPKGQVLHKELRFPHPGGTIEVTVTQKPNSDGESYSSTRIKFPKKGINSENRAEKEVEFCKCHTRGQKWAEILSSDHSKKRQANIGTDVRNKITDEIKTNYEPLNLNNHKMVNTFEYCNKVNPNHQKDCHKVPVELPLQSYKPKEQSEFNTNKFEKETQCSLKELPCRDPVKGPNAFNHLNAFNVFCDQILHGSGDKGGKVTVNLDAHDLKKMNEPQPELSDETKNNFNSKSSSQSGASYKNQLKPECENLKKEKEILSQEIAAKDSVIAALRKREDDYVVLINDLKTHLEKIRGNAHERTDAVREMNFFKTKLLQQVKLSEALKQNHIRMQEIVERCALENDKLKTQIKIFKLEAQKHEVLLAGKEAQISRYKDEILNFQRQISDHLASLKTNAQEIDIEKMMEAIVQQTQLFTKLDGDSCLEKDAKENSELQNALMHSTPHSSPSSTKTSIVNSSWKRISSIHGHELSRANSDFVVYLNDDNKKKDFFEVFNEKPVSEPLTAKRSKASSLGEGPIDKEVKRSSSFTSCLTGEEDRASSHHGSLTSKESTNSVDEGLDATLKKEERISSEVAQNNIEKLLKDMKLKFTKEILETSLPSCSTEDFPDFSQISSLSPVH